MRDKNKLRLILLDVCCILFRRIATLICFRNRRVCHTHTLINIQYIYTYYDTLKTGVNKRQWNQFDIQKLAPSIAFTVRCTQYINADMHINSIEISSFIFTCVYIDRFTDSERWIFNQMLLLLFSFTFFPWIISCV